MALSDQQIRQQALQLEQRGAPMETIEQFVKLAKEEQQKPSTLKRVVGGYQKVLEKTSDALFRNTAKVAGTGLMRTGVLGQDLKEKSDQIDITKGDIALAALETVPFTKVGKAVTGVALKPLTRVAEAVYKSALKPVVSSVGKTSAEVATSKANLVKTGLQERVWLTQGGVEKVANRIDDFENVLGQAIEEAKGRGIKIKTSGLQKYVNEAKEFFQHQANIPEAQAALKELNSITSNFLKKHGDEIPIEKAQKIKVFTGQRLRRYYESMSSAGIEGEKQIVRFLKEKIADNSPVVKDVNKRLASLYKFDQALARSSGRLGNLNLLGIGTKVGGAVGGKGGGAVGLLLDLADRPAIKSGVAIGLNELAKGATGARVPLSVVIKNLADIIRQNSPEEQDTDILEPPLQ